MIRFVSPNEMLDAAKVHMLEGRDPESRDDWIRVMNFMALNVHKDVAKPACRLLAMIYSMPLTEAEVDKIVDHQQQQKS